MWPFEKLTGGREPERTKRESELAKEAAERGLRDAKLDRREVLHVSRLANIQIEKNHISPRITKLLKEGR